MISLFRVATLLLGLALSPAHCLPRPNNHYDARSIHSARATAPFKLPGWEIAVIILGLVVGLILFGVIGGACETLICMHFKRPVRTDPGVSSDGLDFGCQGTPSEMPEIRVIQEKYGGENVSVHHVEIGLGRSASSSSGLSGNTAISSSSGGSSRYSWQDEKGITTEMYLDGTLPDAGPGTTAHDTVGKIQYQGYQVQGAMRGYYGVHYENPAVGLASNPPFVLHNEEDDSDYEHEPEDASTSHRSASHSEFPVAMSTDDVVSPLTPETQSAAWPQLAIPSQQAARYFADVNLEDRKTHEDQ